MKFFRLWMCGYTRPTALVDGLLTKRGYWWGIGAQTLRATLDSLLEYLPVALAGRVPPEAPLLPIPPGRYYWFLVFTGPLIILVETLFGAVLMYAILRFLGRRSNLGAIVNLLGMSGLLVGPVIVAWDWAWFAIGFYDQYFLGITHLLLVLWSVFIVTLGLKRGFEVPVPLGVVLNIVGILAAMTLAVPLMRSPF